jgi:glycosyltransferase involved in cell wall biosynthesis
MNRADSQPAYHIGLVMEQAMGHITHHRALIAEAGRDPAVRATCMPVPYQANDKWQRIPGVSNNLSLLLSLRARSAIRRKQAVTGPFDGLLFHTQVTALLSQGTMRQVPTILSLDATPLNADPLTPATDSRFTRRPDARAPWELAKRHLVRRAFNRAAGLIAWSDWARRSLERDYGVDPAKVFVIPPGVDLAAWHPRTPDAPRHASRLRLLFVGGDFDRKGGDILLQAFRQFHGTAELDLVTPDLSAQADVASHVRVHRGMAINSPELRALYAASDLFVLPTLNDCTPLAVLEAMASGLPVIASNVGAIRELVEPGETGLLVRPGDTAELIEAIRSLRDDPARRRAMGAAARAKAERHYDARSNYVRVLDLLKATVDAWRAARAPALTLRPVAEPGAIGSPAGGNDLEQAWASQH